MSSLESTTAERGLAWHILVFARLLRNAGMTIGTGSVLAATEAANRIGLHRPDDFESGLFACFVRRQEHRELFHQAYSFYWLKHHHWSQLADADAGAGAGKVLDQSAHNVDTRGDEEELARRLAEQFSTEQGAQLELEQQFELDRTQSASRSENLLDKDFESMSAAELREAQRMLKKLQLPVADLPSRRFRPTALGSSVDMRASLKSSLRGGDLMPLRFRKRRTRPATLVVLCDISGSMSLYSRMFLHFMHALSNDRYRVHSFVFGTRLSNISRHLRARDVDRALAATAKSVVDWSGGTRIEECLRRFNQLWSRRVLAQGATVLLISDGLDRGRSDSEGGSSGLGLEREMERLAKSCRHLIWLNPLLRYEGFEPRATGIKAMLPYVDQFRSAHSIRSLEELATVLSSASQSSTAASIQS